MSTRALVILAPGAEEIETVAVVDVLRRAEVDVTLAGLDGDGPVTCSRMVVLTPDSTLEAALANKPYDAVILPGGGGGAESLASSQTVQFLLKEQESNEGVIAAICAGPIALIPAGVHKGKKMTSHPGVKTRVAEYGDYQEELVVRDGPLITGRGPGVAIRFALAIVEALLGEEKAKEIAEPMMLG